MVYIDPKCFGDCRIDKPRDVFFTMMGLLLAVAIILIFL